MQLGHFAACRYSLRHGSASHDLLSQARTPLEVQLRGHWRSTASVARYGKPARAAQLAHRVPPRATRVGLWMTENMELAFHHPACIPLE
eukprot:6472929-Amphidinium_carterae.1